MKQFFGLFVLGLFVVSAIGCGGGNPYGTAQISGKVTYEDGTPFSWANEAEQKAVTLYFYPQADPKDPKTYPRYGSTQLAPDGTFANATTYEYADGVIRGKCKVVVKPTKSGQDVPEKEIKKLKLIDLSFTNADKTPLEFEITPNAVLDIKVKK